MIVTGNGIWAIDLAMYSVSTTLDRSTYNKSYYDNFIHFSIHCIFLGSMSESDVGSSSGVDSGHYTEGESGEAAPGSPVAEHPEGVKPSQRSRAASPDPLHNTGGWILVSCSDFGFEGFEVDVPREK